MQKKEFLLVLHMLWLLLVITYTSAAPRQLDFFFTEHCCLSFCRGSFFSGKQGSQTAQQIAAKYQRKKGLAVKTTVYSQAGKEKNLEHHPNFFSLPFH